MVSAKPHVIPDAGKLRGGLVDDGYGGWEPSRPILYEFLRTYKTIFLKSKQS